MQTHVAFLLLSTVLASAPAQTPFSAAGSDARFLANDGRPRIQPLPAGAEFRTEPRAVYGQNMEAVIPQLIIGGEWTSTIKLTNRSPRTIPWTNVYFIDNLGNPMSATFQTTACSGSKCQPGGMVTDQGFSFSVPPGGIVEATFYGGASTQFGHAFIGICSASGCSSAGLYGEVTLRNSNPVRPDFESVFPIEQPTDLQYMLWDHRNGVTTSLYLVNENVSSTLVSLEFVNMAGETIATWSNTLKPAESQILTLHALAPATIGQQGTLVIRGQNSSGALITATALRINPSGSFTPMRTFVPSH